MAEDRLDIKQLQSIMFKWWNDLENHKGERAALRRCPETPNLIRHAKHFVFLANQLGEKNINPSSIMPILGLLSHVKKESNTRFKDRKMRMAEAMARPKNNNPVISELRFQRILQARDRNELYPLLLRAIRLLDGEINITDLIFSVYFWGEKIRKNWALDYYRTQSQTKEKSS